MSTGISGAVSTEGRTVPPVCGGPRSEDRYRSSGGLKAWQREVERQQLAAWFAVGEPRCDPQHRVGSQAAAALPALGGVGTQCLARPPAVAVDREAALPETPGDRPHPAGLALDARMLRSSAMARSSLLSEPEAATATGVASALVGAAVDAGRGAGAAPWRALAEVGGFPCDDGATASSPSTGPGRAPAAWALPQHPVRLHLDRGDQGDRCFIGHDVGHRALALKAADELRAWARRQGRSFAMVVINGVPCEPTHGMRFGDPLFSTYCGRL